MQKEFYPILRKAPLFAGFQEEGLRRLLDAFLPAVKPFKKGDILVLSGYPVRDIAVLLSGSARAFKDDGEGRRSVHADLLPGGVFGDVLAGSHWVSPVTVEGLQDGEILLLSAKKILEGAPGAPEESRLLLRNLVAGISDKYFMLDRRLALLEEKNLRKRILLFLQQEKARQKDSNTLYLSFDRAALADYLNCDRSALCRELGRMKRDGLIDYYRNSFRLLDESSGDR
ncbi:MAG: Crp/Fnr family transcriptional regulator [Firmicutes bacterium]|nr:Crp/Fnr family transcriptional regulator [Bacillota bacterium]